MKLDLLLNKVDVLEIVGDTNIEISNIQLDSRKISKGEMFIALAGTRKSGDEFIQSAIVNEAKAIVCNNIPSTCSENVTYILSGLILQFIGLLVHDSIRGRVDEKSTATEE